MKNSTPELQKLIEKHLQRAKEFKKNPSGEESRILAQFLVELLAYREYFSEWRVNK